MASRQIIIKALDETGLTCLKYDCDKPEREGNTGKCCHKCSLEILREFENKIYNQALEDVRNLTFRDVTYTDLLNDRTELRELIEQLKK